MGARALALDFRYLGPPGLVNLTGGLPIDEQIILRHIATYYQLFQGRTVNMSVRKRTWTIRKGEQKEAWIVDYFDQAGDRHIETFERKKDADARHATVKVN